MILIFNFTTHNGKLQSFPCNCHIKLIFWEPRKNPWKWMKWLFVGILLKITSSLCKMKSKLTIGVKNPGYYTHLLYILLTVMEIFNTILFCSSLMITTTIQILFIKYKQSLLITLKKNFKLWIWSSISLTAVLNNKRITKTLLFFVIITKISLWMLNRYSLQLVMASHHAMVLGHLLNVMLHNIVFKDPYMTKFWATNECLIYM